MMSFITPEPSLADTAMVRLAARIGGILSSLYDLRAASLGFGGFYAMNDESLARFGLERNETGHYVAVRRLGT